MTMLADIRNRLASMVATGSPTDPETRALTRGNMWPSFGAFGARTTLPALGPIAAFGIPGVSASVQLLSQEIATLPLKIFQDDGDSRVEAKRHPAYNLLRWQPNPIMTASRWRETAQIHVCLWGNSFTEIVFDSVGRPRALWLIEPRQVQMFINESSREILYQYQPEDGDARVLLPSQVLHIRWLTSQSGLWGESPVIRCANAVGLTNAAAEFAARFYADGAHLSGVLSHPASLSDTAFESLKASWQESHQSGRNAHSVAILEEGMTWTPTSVSPEDGQMLPTREFQIAEVARIFGVPAFRIGGSSDTNTYSNIEQETIAFYRNSMRPLLVNWEQEIDAKLLSRNFFSDFDMAEVLRPDVMTRFNSYATAINAGWLEKNEVRILEGLNPIPGLDDEPEPVVAVPVEDEPEDDDEMRQFLPALVATVDRVLTRQCKALDGADAVKVARYWDGQPDVWAESLQPILATVALCGVAVPDFTADNWGAVLSERHGRELELAPEHLNGELWDAHDLSEEILNGLRNPRD